MKGPATRRSEVSGVHPHVIVRRPPTAPIEPAPRLARGTRDNVTIQAREAAIGVATFLDARLELFAYNVFQAVALAAERQAARIEGMQEVLDTLRGYRRP